MEKLPAVMWAGVFDDRIYTTPNMSDDYAPLALALFKTEKEARKRFERVVKIDPTKLLGIGKE